MEPRGDLAHEVEAVVAANNCSGCGACALISDRIVVNESPDGYARPTVRQGNSPPSDSELFRKVCPGVTVVTGKRDAPLRHPIFGDYHSAWTASATDAIERTSGSSAGVITTLVRRNLAQGGIGVGVRPSPEHPTRTVPVRIMTREEAQASSGSRYAPVGASSAAGGLGADDVFVGKPCEVGAIRALRAASTDEAPLLISFFCAGTPSQHATSRIIESRLGLRTDDVTALAYRDSGWPGNFTARTADGEAHTLSYRESWGAVLGKELQWRCKICPDGTSELADIVVGDYWRADGAGYPILEEDADPRSVVICRTVRGEDAFRDAIRDGDIAASRASLDDLVAVQPLQVDRRETMVGRIVGTRLAGRPVPHFRGFRYLRHFCRHPLRNARAAVGAFLRVRGLRA